MYSDLKKFNNTDMWSNLFNGGLQGNSSVTTWHTKKTLQSVA